MINIDNLPPGTDENTKIDILLTEVRSLKSSVGILQRNEAITADEIKVVLQITSKLEARLKALESTSKEAPKQESNKLNDFLKRYGL